MDTPITYEGPNGRFTATWNPDRDNGGDFTIANAYNGVIAGYVVDWRADDGVTVADGTTPDDDTINPFEVYDAATKRYIATTHSLRGACAVIHNRQKGKQP